MIPPTPPKDSLEPSPEDREAALFVARIRDTRPLATRGILVCLAAIFACEITFGGSESMPTLAHMGANVIARTRSGEIERILAASTLHAGPIHALMNLYVLFALGRAFEALVGHARFLVLYVLAALGGGLGTTLLSDASSSVGASGAMWGLLGAMGALAFRPSRLVPARALPNWRRVALTNLGLNVLVSFSPGVDMWAHFGGGLVGAALVGSGVLTAGLSLDRPVSASRYTGAFAALACVLVLLLSTSVGVAWWRGRPWELTSATPSVVRRRLVEVGVSVEVPVLLAGPPAPVPTALGMGASFGDLTVDPYVLVILAQPHAMPDPGVRAAAMEASRVDLDAYVPEDGGTSRGPSTSIAPGGHPGLVRSWLYASGLVYHRIALLGATHEVLVEVVAWPEFEGAREVGASFAASVAPL